MHYTSKNLPQTVISIENAEYAEVIKGVLRSLGFKDVRRESNGGVQKVYVGMEGVITLDGKDPDLDNKDKILRGLGYAPFHRWKNEGRDEIIYNLVSSNMDMMVFIEELRRLGSKATF